MKKKWNIGRSQECKFIRECYGYYRAKAIKFKVKKTSSGNLYGALIRDDMERKTVKVLFRFTAKNIVEWRCECGSDIPCVHLVRALETYKALKNPKRKSIKAVSKIHTILEVENAHKVERVC